MADHSPVVPRWYIGRTLRQLREARGERLADVARHIRKHVDSVRRIESGEVAVSLGDLTVLADHYEADAATRSQLVDLLDQARERGWWVQYGIGDRLAMMLGIEADADAVTGYYHWCVPGHLQTADYARALFSITIPDEPEEERDASARSREERYEWLYGRGADITLYLDEIAIRREVGGPDVMVPQLERIAEAPADVRIVPATAVHPGTTSFMLADVGLIGEVVYLEGFRAGEFILESGDDVQVVRDALARIDSVAMSAEESERFLQAQIVAWRERQG